MRREKGKGGVGGKGGVLSVSSPPPPSKLFSEEEEEEKRGDQGRLREGEGGRKEG